MNAGERTEDDRVESGEWSGGGGERRAGVSGGNRAQEALAESVDGAPEERPNQDVCVVLCG